MTTTTLEEQFHSWLLQCPTGMYDVEYEDDEFVHIVVPQVSEEDS